MRCLFIINSQIKDLGKTIRKINKAFPGATIVQTNYQKHAIEIARKAVHDENDFIIAIGGDGTLNEVLNGMLTSATPINKLPILGAIQRGSANDFSRSLSYDNSLDQLKELVDKRQTTKIDIGKIKRKYKDDDPSYFINIAGLGLGPEVVLLMEKNNKFWGAKLSYFKSIIQGFSNYEKKKVVCVGDGWEWEGNLLQMAVGNGKYFGHEICVCPDAKLDDGLFHVSLFGNMSMTDYLKNLGNLKRGKKITHPEAHYFTTKDLHIEVEESDTCGIEGDGEYIGQVPATISIVPKAIHFLNRP